MMHVALSLCVESVWNPSIHPSSARSPPPIKGFFHESGAAHNHLGFYLNPPQAGKAIHCNFRKAVAATPLDAEVMRPKRS